MIFDFNQKYTINLGRLGSNNDGLLSEAVKIYRKYPRRCAYNDGGSITYSVSVGRPAGADACCFRLDVPAARPLPFTGLR